MPKLRVLIATLAAVLLMSGCEVGADVVMWGPCEAGPNVTGTDKTYVLVCRDGTWEPLMTVDEFVQKAKGTNVAIAPLPTRPTTTTTTTTTSTTSTTVAACVQSCDGANLTVAVNRQPNGTWGYVTGTGLQPGSDITLCDDVTPCNVYTTVSGSGTFSLGPRYCCDSPRTEYYVISTTAANGLTITSNSVSH